jgi:hypothetical protein
VQSVTTIPTSLNVTESNAEHALCAQYAKSELADNYRNSGTKRGKSDFWAVVARLLRMQGVVAFSVT